MSWDSYFTDGDKPYSENLNDSLMLCDAFDVTVPCDMPGMFSNGMFSSSVNVTRKCGVALVTLKSVDEGVTVGTDEISGTGSVVFRVYPNFNSFYKWSKIILEKSGTVDISFKKIDGTAISATVGSDGTISEAAALKELQEIDVVLSLTSATVSDILIWFVNNQGERVRTGALLEAGQLVNVNGTVTVGDTGAVSGDTVKAAFDSFSTGVVDEKIDDLSDSVDDKLALKENLSNKVTSLNTGSSGYYPTTTAVKNAVDTKADKEWVDYSLSVTDGQLFVNESLRLVHYALYKNITFTGPGTVNLEILIPESFWPSRGKYVVVALAQGQPVLALFEQNSREIRVYSPVAGEIWIRINELWRY